MGNFRPARLPAAVQAHIDAGNPLPKGWFDFKEGVYFYPFFRPGGLLDFNGVTFSRASSGWAIKDGALPEFTDNTPQVGDGGFLCEPERTNDLRSSIDIGGASWSGVNYAFTSSADAPFSGQTAKLASRSSTSSSAYIVQPIPSYAPGSALTLSVYAKAGIYGSRIGARIQSVYPDRADAVFDLATGQLVGTSPRNYTNVTASMLAHGNGWYRCILNATVGSTTTTQVLIGATVSASSIGIWESAFGSPNDVRLWGAQLEPGNGASSLIPTTTSAITRAASSCIFDGSKLGWAADQAVLVTYDDDSTATLNATAASLTLPVSLKAYSLLIVPGDA